MAINGANRLLILLVGVCCRMTSTSILPFTTNVPVRTWAYQAFLHGMLWRYQWFRNLFFNLNINLGVHEVLRRPATYGFASIEPLLFPENIARIGYIDCRRLSPLVSPRETLAAIYQDLADGYYVWMTLDHTHLPESVRFNGQQGLHETLLVGTDDHGSSFLMPTYGQHGRYAVRQVADARVTAAIENTINTGGFKYVGYRPKLENPVLPLSGPIIAAQLQEYCASISSNRAFPWFDNSSPGDSSGKVFGLAACQLLVDYVEARVCSRMFLDVRFTRQLWEIKAVMLQRLKIVEAAGVCVSRELIAAFENIALECRLLHVNCVGYITASRKVEPGVLCQRMRLALIEECSAMKMLEQMLRAGFE